MTHMCQSFFPICMSSTHVHVLCTWAPSDKSSIVDLEATVQKNNDTTKAIHVMLALTGADSVTATYNVGKQVERKAMEQPTQTMCPSLVTLKPILINMLLSNVATKRLRARVQFALCSLIDCTVCCACEARSSCLKPLTKRSCRRWERLLLISQAFEYNRHPLRNGSTANIPLYKE